MSNAQNKQVERQRSHTGCYCSTEAGDYQAAVANRTLSLVKEILRFYKAVSEFIEGILPLRS